MISRLEAIVSRLEAMTIMYIYISISRFLPWVCRSLTLTGTHPPGVRLRRMGLCHATALPGARGCWAKIVLPGGREVGKETVQEWLRMSKEPLGARLGQKGHTVSQLSSLSVCLTAQLLNKPMPSANKPPKHPYTSLSFLPRRSCVPSLCPPCHVFGGKPGAGAEAGRWGVCA